MAASGRIRLCGNYQYPRCTPGVPGCGHSSKACPYGAHKCSKCGKGGHGYFDCKSDVELEDGWYEVGVLQGNAQPTMPLPQPPAPPPLPPPPAPPSPKKRRVITPTPPKTAPPGYVVASSSAQEAPVDPPLSATQEEAPVSEEPLHPALAGIGSKGYGKGNFGTALPPPVAIPTPAGGASSSAAHWDSWTDCVPAVPEPIPAKNSDVESWLEHFTPFTATNCMPPPPRSDSRCCGVASSMAVVEVKALLLSISTAPCGICSSMTMNCFATSPDAR